MFTRKQAVKIVKQYLDNPNLIKHSLAVEAAMEAYADYFEIRGEEREQWKISGLLHDADWEKYPKEHPQVIVNHLKRLQVDEKIINAIAAHGFEFGVEAKTLMAKVLRAVDELTGFIVAIALVKGRDLDKVTVKSVLKKWKEKRFAAGVKRKDIERGAEEIGLPLERHIEIVLQGMKKIKKELGL